MSHLESGTKSKVLFVYYTFTKQALKVTQDMEGVCSDAARDFAHQLVDRLGAASPMAGTA